ncbi:hypothetical protein L7F22_017709 [Adiantum nelumboides]|nr:hypothetical protein [Adiantum nelumboides]
MPQSPTVDKRRIGIAVDFNEESVYAIEWAVSSYIHPDDTVVLLHVQASDVLFGADWGDVIKGLDSQNVQEQNEQDIYSLLNSSKLVEPLQEAKVRYKIHAVKDYDRKERICLEAERLKLNALVIGDSHNSSKKKTGFDSIGEYCMHHCECPVLVVRSDGDTRELTNRTATLNLDSKI